MGVDRSRLRGRTRGFFAYGGDFGEPLHDSNFVADGLVFPDRTPSPGLLELKKVFEPVQISVGRDGRGSRTGSRSATSSHLRFEWALEEEGVAVASGYAAASARCRGRRRRSCRCRTAADVRRDWPTVRACWQPTSRGTRRP